MFFRMNQNLLTKSEKNKHLKKYIVHLFHINFIKTILQNVLISQNENYSVTLSRRNNKALCVKLVALTLNYIWIIVRYLNINKSYSHLRLSYTILRLFMLPTMDRTFYLIKIDFGKTTTHFM